MDFIEVKSGQFVYQGETIRLRGFGVGTWLCLEHFMIGLPASENTIRNVFRNAYGNTSAELFFKTFQESFITENDFKILKECGVNFIRVPFNYRLFIDDNHPGTLKEHGFIIFDKLFKLCSQYQIFAMIDLHAAPGSQNPDWHSDNSAGIPLFWNYYLFRRQTVKLWGAIAERYCDEPYLMGYDLLNEPAMADWDILNSFYNEAISEIRAVDKNHIIVLEGSSFSMDFSELNVFNDGKLAIGFHYYPTVWSPGLLDAAMDSKTRNEKVRNGLNRILEQTKKFGWPVLCGEFGYAPKDCGSTSLALELLTGTLDLLEEYAISWLLWCYKDIGYMGMLSPHKKSAWTALADAVSADWTQNIEKEQAETILDMIAAKWFPLISDQEKYLLQFRIRSCFYMTQGQHILLPRLLKIDVTKIQAMALDFAAENCVLNSEVNNVIKKFLMKR
jgi:hypothetical protein